ncbi:hypothetical protein BDW66DRAFT_152874 [Aspergillus desertorum]
MSELDDYILVLGAAGAASFCGVLIPIFLEDVWGRHAWDIPASSIVSWFIEMSLQHQRDVYQNVNSSVLPPHILHIAPRPSVYLERHRCHLVYMALTICMLARMVSHRGDGGWGSRAHLQRMGDASRVIDFTQGVFSVVPDFYVIAIPTVIVFRLNLAKKRKLGVACIFLVGFV